MPMWQKKIHSLSFWFSQEQRLSRRWAVWVSCAGGASSTVGLILETVDAGEKKKQKEPAVGVHLAMCVTVSAFSH